MKKTLLFVAGMMACASLQARGGDSNLTDQTTDAEKVAVAAEKQDAAVTATEDRSALKLIDDLTEKLYLQRKKHWDKEQENLWNK